MTWFLIKECNKNDGIPLLQLCYMAILKGFCKSSIAVSEITKREMILGRPEFKRTWAFAELTDAPDGLKQASFLDVN